MSIITEDIKNIILKDPNCFKSILGQEEVKKNVKSALIANRHILIIGPPGIGKTTLAKNIANLLPPIEVYDCPYHCSVDNPACPTCRSDNKPATKEIKGLDRIVRVQGSPDLTAEDLIGDIDPMKAMKFGPLSIEAFNPGKLFKANNGILFFDELNRCPEKLQNALLQALQEGIITIGSYDVDIPTNFIFIATMNPEDSSTEKVSDVLADRFDVVYMDYPETKAIEKEIVISEGKEIVPMDDRELDFAIEFVRKLRSDDNLERVPSVRASIGLYERAQANAAIARRDKVIINDVLDAIVSVISHRISLKPSADFLQTAQDFLKKEIEEFLKKKQIERELGELG